MKKRVDSNIGAQKPIGVKYETPKCEIIELCIENGMMLTNSQQPNPGFDTYSEEYYW